jgi:hypothetical protein
MSFGPTWTTSCSSRRLVYIKGLCVETAHLLQRKSFELSCKYAKEIYYSFLFFSSFSYLAFHTPR